MRFKSTKTGPNGTSGLPVITDTRSYISGLHEGGGTRSFHTSPEGRSGGGNGGGALSTTSGLRIKVTPQIHKDEVTSSPGARRRIKIDKDDDDDEDRVRGNENRLMTQRNTTANLTGLDHATNYMAPVTPRSKRISTDMPPMNKELAMHGLTNQTLTGLGENVATDSSASALEIEQVAKRPENPGPLETWLIDDVCSLFVKFGAGTKEIQILRRHMIDGEVIDHFNAVDFLNVDLPYGLFTKLRLWKERRKAREEPLEAAELLAKRRRSSQ